MRTKSHACPRCGGKGRLECFSHVIGGTCFRCSGTGRIAGKAPEPLTLYAVSLVRRDSGELVRIYNLRAKSAEQALNKARVTYENASSAFRDEFTCHGATAVPA